ncbi:uncharacterized protein PSFLO_06889 [Pseudozyma flocculosa]|uniref:Uncharacterized protein n=1 Tax=Pseudozyma flocculosa TaxID=84751 RepID=A0A5C3FCQ1_9BASI|nr:uncharacterized protein PSFLO_06889 [Pseudozyma flocculosa]
MSACLLACLPACLLACLLACLPACPLARLPACLLACLPACLLACLLERPAPSASRSCSPARPTPLRACVCPLLLDFCTLRASKHAQVDRRCRLHAYAPAWPGALAIRRCPSSLSAI